MKADERVARECPNCGVLVPWNESHYSGTPAFGYQCERPASLPPAPPTRDAFYYKLVLGKIAATLGIEDGERFEPESLTGKVAALRAEVAALRQFAGKAIHATRILEIGDWDGGEVQDAMEACGLIAPVEATEPCGDDCRCAEYDEFPQTCYRLTKLGQRAARSSAAGEDRSNGK